MSLFNIEIFDQEYNYIDSYQLADLTYEYDYLSITNSKIKIPKIKCSRGDLIRISNDNHKVCGVCEGVSESDTMITIEFKLLLKILDVNAHFDVEKWISKDVSVEKLLADQIAEIYIKNEDEAQNIKGLRVECHTSTVGEKKISLDGAINNLYEVAKQALTKHDVVIDIDLDIQAKSIKVVIKKSVDIETPIEADLPNVLVKNFAIQNGEEAVNKLVVYQEDSKEHRTFYLLKNGLISQDEKHQERIYPVVSDMIEIDVREDESLDELASQEASSYLVREEYDNLIEITTLSNDSLVKPMQWAIGDKAIIYHNGTEYHTILTGYEVKQKRITLMFGAVRMELTKLLKRRRG